MGATTKEKLYKILFDDGDLLHLTLPEVKEAYEACMGNVSDLTARPEPPIPVINWRVARLSCQECSG